MDNINVGDRNLQDEGAAETNFGVSNVPSSSYEDDSTEAKENANARCFVPFWGLVLCIMTFFGFLCLFALRVSISVAIVAMVNHTALTEDVEATNATNTSDTGQCPRDEALQRADGEFVWDRHQQATALAAYYYGCIITQVCSYKDQNVGH